MTQLKRKGKIQENNIPLKIVFMLYQLERPLSLSEMARFCKCPRQKIDYHVTSLISKGIILQNLEDRKYTIQPGLQNSGLVELLEPLIAAVLKGADLTQSSRPIEEIASSIIEYFLQLHVLDV